MNRLGLLLYIAAICLLTACGASSIEKCEEALNAGNLREAESYLKEINNRDVCRYYSGLLIDEYLAIGNLDRAIYVFDKITGHCSMYEMQYNSLYASADYTKRYSKKIFDALLKDGRYDEAWNYHARSYNNDDYPGNAPDYFAYMSDVIIAMYSSGQSMLVQQFINQKSVWFLKNVDNHEWGKNYPNYRYDIVRSELNKVYNNAK
ncbi:MAG: hypothetical protein IKV17_07045 [Bacteroidaceae bacterium]|nr:hypothetical protein [Bacteroidaceae bacterium]